MPYRDDDEARTQRANELIDQIAQLERQRVEKADLDRRLDAARNELGALQTISLPPPPPESERASLATHIAVFVGTAGTAFLGYTLLV